MIRSIMNQPINFGGTNTLGCSCDPDQASLIAAGDDVRFQVAQIPCLDATTYLPDTFEDWRTVSWTLLGTLACIGSENEGAALGYDFFDPVPGQAYRLSFVANIDAGAIRVNVGGFEYLITGSGSFDLFFIASTTDELAFTAESNVTDGCIQTPQVTDVNTAITVTFRNGEDTLFTTDFDTDPQYFQFLDGAFNFFMPFNVAGIAEGCFVIDVIEDCGGEEGENALTSQTFKVVADDCETLVIRGCNDYSGMGFKVPFAPRARIASKLSRPNYTYTVSDERYSNGEHSRPFADRQRVMNLHVAPANESDHLFLSALVLMDHQYIEDGEYLLDASDWEPDYADVWDSIGGLVKPVFPKYEKLTKSQCGPPLEGCSPLLDPICPVPSIAIAWANRVLVSDAGSTDANGVYSQTNASRFQHVSDPLWRIDFISDEGGYWILYYADPGGNISYYVNYTASGGLIVSLEELVTPWALADPGDGEEPVPVLTFCEGMDLKVTFLSLMGFIPDEVTITYDGDTSTPQTINIGALPEDVLFGPYPNGVEVLLAITETTLPTCTYTQLLTVPGEACPLPPDALIVADAGTPGVNGGYYQDDDADTFGYTPDPGTPVYVRGVYRIIYSTADFAGSWVIVESGGAMYDSTPSLFEFPWEVLIWFEASGDSPAPTVTEA